MFRFGHKFLLTALLVLVGAAPLAAYYYLPDHRPPDAPPNYNQIDPELFYGVPPLSSLLPGDMKGCFVYFDAAESLWTISSVVKAGTTTFEQFHGSILVQMDDEPQPGVNVLPQGFDLTTNLHRNDRWGWVRWPESIAPNLYEIWWDITLDCPGAGTACTRTIGYWKTHAGFGPQDDVVTPLLPIWLGTPGGAKSICVTTAAMAVDLLSMKVYGTASNGITKLYAQLLGAKLNLAAGADDAAAADVIALADAYLTGHNWQDWSLLTSREKNTILAWMNTLDQYNNGLIGPEHCDDTVPNNTGDPACIIGISFKGCAFDFNLWESSYNGSFDAGLIHLGEQMIPLSDVSGFFDFFPGIDDTYGHPFDCGGGACLEPNLSVFTAKMSPGAAYNVNGLILPGNDYGDAYAGSKAYEGNGIEFSVNDCGANNPPIFDPPIGYLKPLTICLGSTIHDTIIATDFDAGDVVTLTKVSGPGSFASTPGYPPVYGYYTWTPSASGSYTVVFEAVDSHGASVVDSNVYLITFNQPPTALAQDTTVFSCWGADQICYLIPAADPEHDPLTFSLISGPGIIDPVSGELCFMPGDTGNYSFAVEVSDTCGADTAAFTVTVDVNHDPIIKPYDTLITLCEPDTVCFEVQALDPDSGDSLEVTLISGPGQFTQTGNGVGIHCFMPEAVDHARYVFYFSVTDDCWRGMFLTEKTPPAPPIDSIVVIVDINGGPEITCPGDAFETLCEPESLCYQIEATDPDGDDLTYALISGPGYVDPFTGRFCFYADAAGEYAIAVAAADTCGIAETCEFTITVDLNQPPTVDISNRSVFLCAPEEVCIPVILSDPDHNIADVTVFSDDGNFAYDGNDLCFTPSAEGVYEVVVTVSDSCGLTDADTAAITVTLNQPPTVNIDSLNLFSCGATQVCLLVRVFDPDGSIDSIVALPPASYNAVDQTVCLYVTEAGAYGASVIAFDNCGAAGSDIGIAVVAINTPPQVTAPADTSILQCESGEVCLDGFVVDDIDGNLKSLEFYPGGGSYADGRYCFKPDTAGVYCLVARATDSCGTRHEDTVCVTVALGADVAIDCPEGPQIVSLCEPDSICLEIPIQPVDAEVMILEPGAVYKDGKLCFYAEVAGVRAFTLVAGGECGTDTCRVVFNVTVDEAPQITCPQPDSVHLCGPDSISVPLAYTPSSARVAITPPAVYADGNLTFFADTAGEYCFEAIAVTNCGSDTCSFCITVTIDSPPSVSIADTTVELCAPEEICIPYNYFDPDDNVVSVTVTTLKSLYRMVEGKVCFTPPAAGTYDIALKVTDSCGLTASDTATVTVTLNKGPLVHVGDTTLFSCGPTEVCLPVTAFDPDGTIDSIVAMAPAQYNAANGSVCLAVEKAGTYRIAVKAYDDCGAAAVDIGVALVTFNRRPYVTAPKDTTVSACEPQEICLDGFDIFDLDENISNIEFFPNIGTYADGRYCFMPDTAGRYCLVIRVTDACGAAAEDTVCITFELDSPPIVSAPDSSIYLCEIEPICIPVSYSDPEGNVIDVLVGPEGFEFVDGDVCFTPTSAGIYEFSVTVTDDCGHVAADTAAITVTMNEPPLVNVGDDSVFICEPTDVCLPVTVSDPEGAIDSIAVTPPAIYDPQNQRVCLPVSASGTYDITVTVYDDCGASASDAGGITVVLNSPPAVTLPKDTSLFLCQAAPVCIPVIYGDPDGNIAAISVLPPEYDLVNDSICFEAMLSGLYQIVVSVTDSCGLIAADTMKITVSLNQPPVVTVGDSALFVCEPTNVCLPVSAFDPEGRIDSIVVTAPGYYDSQNQVVCLRVDGTGEYAVIVRVYDDCGVSASDVGNVNVIMNSAPNVTAPADTTVFQCAPAQICLSGFIIGDANGNIESVDVVPNIGSYSDGRYCFTPDTAGTYCFTIRVTDECGEVAEDVFCITVKLGADVVVTCPEGVQEIGLCNPDSVCLDIPIYPADAIVSVLEPGAVYADGRLCFYADAAGTYTYTVIAENECGRDTCQVVFDVGLDAVPQVTCPPADSIHLCSPDTIEVPVAVTPATAQVTVNPPATYENGMVKFFAGTAGEYCFEVVAATSCGSDTCRFCVTVTIDSPPQVTIADTSVYQCSPEQICVPYDYSDPDNNVVSVTVEPSRFSLTEGTVCFTPSGTGTYNIILTVADSCGHRDSDTAHVVVKLNDSPSVSVRDTAVFLCQPTDVCIPVLAADQDGGIDSVVVRAPAYYDAGNNTVCLPVSASGQYSVTVTVYDTCGASASDAGIITATLNSPPVVTVPADTAVVLCDVEQVCLNGFVFADVDNNIINREFLPNIGTYAAGRYCFTPDTAGIYCLVAKATDKCGAVDMDTVCVTVEFGGTVAIDCPTEPQVVRICDPDTVCVALPVEPVDAKVHVVEPGGYYLNGELCFYATAAGIYTFTVVASGECNADTCVVTVDVTIGEPPQIVCPPADTVHLCGPDSVAAPVAVNPPTATVSVTPPAVYADGKVTFYADKAGTYCYQVIATDLCGADTCSFCVTVTIDAPPIVIVPDSSLTLCALTSICIPVSSSDPDGNIDSIIVDPPNFIFSDGRVCFTPPAAGNYNIIVTAVDSCGHRDVDTGTVVVRLNQGPSVHVTDSALFLCESGTVCLPVTMSDPDGPITSVVVVPPATYDADNRRVCRPVSAAGVYNLIITVYDACGVAATDTGTATVSTNTPPTVAFGAFTSPMQLCNLNQICVPIVVSDAQNNIIRVTGRTTCGTAVITGGYTNFCWTPNSFGACTLTVIVEDACGKADTATAPIILVEAPRPDPPCIGNDTIYACGPGQVCVDLGVANPGSHITIKPGTFTYNPSTGKLCYNATTNRADTVTVRDSTMCGIDSCKFVLTTIMNRPPVITGDTLDDVVFCHSTTICAGYAVSDPDNNIDTILVRGDCPGAVLDAAHQQVCMTVTTAVDCDLKIIVVDDCGLADTLNLPIVATPNQPPQVSLPDIETIVRCATDTSDIVFADICVTDPDYDEVALRLDSGLGGFTFNSVLDCGELRFRPPTEDTAQYCFRFMATDLCDTVYARFCVNVLPALVCSTCVEVAIEGPPCVNSGGLARVDVTAETFNQIGGYDLLIGYDASALTLLRADLGSAITGWEYFTYRFGNGGNCEAPCPSGILRLVAIADINNGPAHPPVDQYNPHGVLASITFRVTPDLNFGGQHIPVDFFWNDCGDNGFSDITGQYLFVDHAIFSQEGNIVWDEFNNAAYPESERPIHVGTPDSCLEGDKFVPVRCVSYSNGEVCIQHPDSIDARGDLNLNGVRYEIADAVVYTNYFIRGLDAFSISPAGQIAASDINADGRTLSIADLVYLIRVIVGDAPPYPKEILLNNTVPAACSQKGQDLTVSINSLYDVGAVLMIFAVDGSLAEAPALASGASGMEMKTGWLNGEYRVLLYSFDVGKKISAGASDLITLTVPEGCSVRLTEMELADYYGRTLQANISNAALPNRLDLTQNRPNPFNPTTVFELALPEASDYVVTIYNITGQVIRKWSGAADAGYVTFEWDGRDDNGRPVASGIYFYRAQALGLEAIKKMMLVK